jgi:benzoate/toluate 1,2-dioxygenase beta subunit
LLITEWRAGDTQHWAGWCGYRLKRRGASLEIEVKQVNLIDCDQSLRNPSIVL